MKRVRPSEIGARFFYRYMTGVVAPRPIALVSTIDKAGNVNLSPFSFFNYMGIDPPIVAFAPNKTAENSEKDTMLNIGEVPEAVINLVDYDMVQQVSLASSIYERGVNEFVKAGFTSVLSEKVTPPRVGESPVHLECKILKVITIGSMNLVIAEVVLAHFSERILDATGQVDTLKTKWVGRAGRNWYSYAGKDTYFEVRRPSKGIGVDVLPSGVRYSAILTGNDLGILGSIPALPSESEIRQYGYNAVVAALREQTSGVCENFNELLHIRVKELLAEGKPEEALLAALQTH